MGRCSFGAGDSREATLLCPCTQTQAVLHRQTGHSLQKMTGLARLWQRIQRWVVRTDKQRSARHAGQADARYPDCSSSGPDRRGTMNLSGISNKSLLGRLLRLPLRLIPPRTVVRILQGSLRGKKWIASSSSHGCWLGNYEYVKRILFERTVRENGVVFDVGAHVGFYTLLASVLVGSRGSVFAFEPFPANLLYLKEHLRLNNIDNVTVVEAAVSENTGTAFFSEGPSSSTGHISPNGRLEVETVAIDELVAKKDLPVPDYIKMDIEGAEASALSGAKSTLAQFHPTIFLATHGSSIHQECCRLLWALDYELQPIDGTNLETSDEILATYNTG